jgi:phosphoglucomutase
MKKIMTSLHNNELIPLLPNKVKEIYDYLNSVMIDENNNKHKLLLPSSDVIKYVMEDGNSFVIRPSGTEPKIKIYFTMKGNSFKETQNKKELYEKIINDFVMKMEND